MSDEGREKSLIDDLPRPKVHKTRWPMAMVWIVPILAAVVAAYYFVDYRNEHAREIVIRFADAQGLKPGETPVSHLGVDIGMVSSLELAADHSSVLVHVQLHKSALDFAREGTQFWVERAEVSAGNISGLTTVISGPYIDGIPGTGPATTAFTGADEKPVTNGPGLRFSLQAARLAHLERNSALYFRGIQVGVVEGVQLNPDASGVTVHVFVRERYAPLVRANSQFWIQSGIDVSGGLFSGLKLNLESLRALLGGAVAFATPDDNAPPASSSSVFELNDEPKKEWLAWPTHIPLPTLFSENGDKEDAPPPPATAPTAP